jgi:2-polyprenyl-3-methyl-5-hydroxy-6-metoxy-1,4-benzoquinol methylase
MLRISNAGAAAKRAQIRERFGWYVGNRRPPPRSPIWEQDYAQGRYDFLADLGELGHYSVLVGYLQFFGCREVLDVGCGDGLLRTRLGPLPDLVRYVGIDPTREAIRRARARMAEDTVTSFICGDLGSTELDPFDAVVLNEVLYFMPTASTLSRVQQLVRPGGLILVSMYRGMTDRWTWRQVGSRFTRLDSVSVTNRHFTWHVAAYSCGS